MHWERTAPRASRTAEYPPPSSLRSCHTYIATADIHARKTFDRACLFSCGARTHPLPSTSSGAMYSGVPHMVYVRPVVCFAKPKSTTLQ
jgi:hypothetical protein